MQTKRTGRIEESLSQFGALLSLAADDIAQAKQTINAAEERLVKLQEEIEKLYVTLNEPMIIMSDKSKRCANNHE